MSRTYARARLGHTPGQMNKTEERRLRTLEAEVSAGWLVAALWSPMKLRLADNTFLTLDFLLVRPDGGMELEDVKGRKGDSYYTTEDARVKIKVAARLFPWFRIFTVWEDRQGIWRREEIPPC